MTKVLENIFKVVLNALIVFVLLVIALIIYGQVEKNFSGNNYSNYFGYTLFKVSSGSMGDYVSVKDVILVKITKDVEKDDVITFYSGNTFTTHRIIDMKGDKLITKGDANNAKDVAITKDDVVGKVVHIFVGLEVWREVFSTPKVFIAILITLVLFDCAFSYKMKERKEIEREERRNRIISGPQQEDENKDRFTTEEIINNVHNEENPDFKKNKYVDREKTEMLDLTSILQAKQEQIEKLNNTFELENLLENTTEFLMDKE